LVVLEHIHQASRAVERGEETTEDLRYLQGKGTSLGGMRPRCTIVGQDGRLAIGKFPSVNDTRSEVLALKLAQLAGIDAAPARIVSLAEVPVAVIRRFDRDGDDGRIPYLDILDFWQSSGMALTR
jgi:serine/threonine-protein kinase HipA